MKEVVISAYDRDYHYWVNNLNKDIKVTVYRKGTNYNLADEIYLENNVGRDVHTFFYHIVNNYDNLANYTFTSQDYFHDHVRNYIDIMNGDIRTLKENAVQDFGECWFYCTQYGGKLNCDKNGAPHHAGLDIPTIWNQLFKIDCPDTIVFTPTGHFCATNKHIQKRPLTFYKKVLNILETNEQAPWIIERLEPYIFDLNYDINE